MIQCTSQKIYKLKVDFVFILQIDDQICLLINSWCELLLLSCCFRSMDSPGEIRVSPGRTMTLQQAEVMGIGPCIERMLNLTYQLSRLQVDKYEYMAMKVIVLLSSGKPYFDLKTVIHYRLICLIANSCALCWEPLMSVLNITQAQVIFKKQLQIQVQ